MEQKVVMRPRIKAPVVKNTVVVGGIKFQVGEIAHRRVVGADLVDQTHIRLDVARRVKIAVLQLVFFAVEVFVLGRKPVCLAEFKPRIHSPVARQGPRQDHPRPKARATGSVIEIGVDVGRVGEKIRPHGVAAVLGGKLCQVFGKVRGGFAPGVVGIALGKAQLGQTLHHLWVV